MHTTLLSFVVGLILFCSTSNASFEVVEGKHEMTGQWPSMRGGTFDNRGVAEHELNWKSKAEPWSFRTERGIFSTPVVDDNGYVYIGSADKNFYALNPKGEEVWRYETKQIIDSAAVLTKMGNSTFVTIPGGDGYLHHLRLRHEPSAGDDPYDLMWKFNLRDFPHPYGKGYEWFEGNVRVGPDGDFYAGSTNYNFYAVNSNGDRKWVFPAMNMNWSAATFDKEGYLYMTSLDRWIRKIKTDEVREVGVIKKNNKRKLEPKVEWSAKTWGFNVGTIAVAGDMIVASSFDGNVYAFHKDGPKTQEGSIEFTLGVGNWLYRVGYSNWKFTTKEHIYASPAVTMASEKEIGSVYITSTDGFFYALDGKGKEKCSFNTESVIRSSPVVGYANGKEIIFFGAGNGKLYALDSSCELVWSFDTTPDPSKLGSEQDYDAKRKVKHLAMRNDLNASPALGKDGVYIAGEHGHLWYVPYGYPQSNPSDKRVTLKKKKPKNGLRLRILQAGGDPYPGDVIPELDPSTAIGMQLELYENGEKLNVGLNYRYDQWWQKIVTVEPGGFDFEWQVDYSASKIYLIPNTFLAPGKYTIKLNGTLFRDGKSTIKIGPWDFTLKGRSFPSFKKEVSFTVRDDRTQQQDDIDILKFSRIAIPNPTMLTSLNQIGFDHYELLVKVVDRQEPVNGETRFTGWLISAGENDDGDIVPIHQTEFKIPIDGIQKGSSFKLFTKGVPMTTGGIKLKIDNYDFMGHLDERGNVIPGAMLYAKSELPRDWFFAIGAVWSKLVNSNRQIPFTGTYIGKKWEDKSKRDGVDSKLTVVVPPTISEDGQIRVLLSGNNSDTSKLVPGIFIRDAKTKKVITMDYVKYLKYKVSKDGLRVKLHLPRYLNIPKNFEIFVMADITEVGRFDYPSMKRIKKKDNNKHDKGDELQIASPNL